MAQHRAARGQRCGEDAVCASHAAPLRGRVREHEQSRDGAGPFTEPGLCDGFDGLADLLVQLSNRGLNGHELRLDLDDEGDSSGRPPGEDVDRAALAERGVRDLDLDPPAETKKEADDDAGDAGMAGVEKPIRGRPRARRSLASSARREPRTAASSRRRTGAIHGHARPGIRLAATGLPACRVLAASGATVVEVPGRSGPERCRPRPHDRERHVSATYLRKRSARNGSIGHSVAPSVTRSARMSPINGANLKPWPEQAEANATPGAAGWRSTMKRSSSVFV